MKAMNKDFMYLYPIIFFQKIFVICSDMLKGNPSHLGGSGMLQIG